MAGGKELSDSRSQRECVERQESENRELETETPGGRGHSWRSPDPGVALEMAAGVGAERSLEQRVSGN